MPLTRRHTKSVARRITTLEDVKKDPTYLAESIGVDSFEFVEQIGAATNGKVSLVRLKSDVAVPWSTRSIRDGLFAMKIQKIPEGGDAARLVEVERRILSMIDVREMHVVPLQVSCARVHVRAQFRQASASTLMACARFAN